MNEYEFQNNRVYQWLLNGNEITTLIQDYHVPIHKERVKNSCNRGYHTRYSMVKENRELLKDVPLGFAHKYEDVVFWQIGNEPTNLYGTLNHE